MENEKFQELVLEKLSILTTEVKEVKNTVANVKTRLAAVEQGQLRIETRLENEVIEKIRALFDDRSTNQDYFANIKNSLTQIEENVEVLYQKSVDQEIKLVEHDRELRLLRIERK